MESATAAVMTLEPVVHRPSSVRAYLLTINPLVNFDRWLLANFLYWASLFIGAIVAFVVAALA
jgi:hypothetical protein